MTKTLEHMSLGDAAYELFNANREVVGDHFRVEPLEVEFPYLATDLAREFGARSLFLARAGDNEAGTSKARGAFVGASLLKAQGAEKIRLASAGNHARGSVIAARVLGMGANVAVPASAPYEKSDGLYSLMDDSRLHVERVEGAFANANDWILAHPELGELLHPYDDPGVIAGQGTLADDIFRALPDTDRVVVALGGGGHAAGIRERADELGYERAIVHGIEAEGSDSLSVSLESGNIMPATNPNARYGGSAVRYVGERALKVLRDADKRFEVSSVSDDEVEKVMGLYQQLRRDLWRMDTPAYEPTTLVAVAGLAAIARDHPDETIVVVGTGHNAPLPDYI